MLVRGLQIRCLASFSKYVATQPALAINAVQTSNLSEGKYCWECQVFYSDLYLSLVSFLLISRF